MNKVGLFLQDVAAGLPLAKKHQPRAALLMDASSTQIRYVRDNAPSEVVWWKHEGDRHWSSTNPEEWAETIWAQVEPCPPDYTYFWNEPLWHGAISQFADFDDRQARFIRRMRQLSNGQVKVGAFCFAEGNFTKDGPDIPDNFPKTMDEAEMVFIHEYWKPRLGSDGMEGYHCLRWPHWLEQFERAGRPDLPIAVTECGLTMAVGGGPDVGYLSAEAMAAGVTWQLYRDDLSEYHTRCCQEPRVKFMVPFLCSPWAGQWQTFRLDINTELLDYLMTMQAPNGGNMAVKIYDFDHAPSTGATTTWDWLRSVFGPKLIIHPVTEIHQLKPGDWYYAVDYLDARVGDSNCIINVRDENGKPVSGETVIFWWESAEKHGYPGTDWCWTENGATGDTNENGDVGPGMGKGAYYDPKTGEGPHKVWIYDLSAEMVSGIGMVPGGDPDPNTPGEEGPHAHVNVGYKRVQYAGGEPPVPPSTDDATLLRQAAQTVLGVADRMGQGTPAKIIAVFGNGSQVEYKPSAVSSAVARAKAFFRK